VIGAQILAGSHSPLLQLAEIIAGSHHERWDGHGYHGLAGEDIPLHARITTLADAFDAMTTDRPYRAARPREEALEEIQRERGGQFDPTVVDAFMDLGNDALREASTGAESESSRPVGSPVHQ
jgi:putative two-component system response regulator